jgi:hypothetical protein
MIAERFDLSSFIYPLLSIPSGSPHKITLQLKSLPFFDIGRFIAQNSGGHSSHTSRLKYAKTKFVITSLRLLLNCCRRANRKSADSRRLQRCRYKRPAGQSGGPVRGCYAGEAGKNGISLISIDKAEQQVVAGMNYKVCLKVRNGKRVRYATAVVYRDLKGKRSLSSWDWGECNW